jgi:hypothetical protein
LTLLSRTVNAKRSPAVLRLALLQVRGRFPDLKILVFEGVDDVGVYQEWIRRFRDENWFRPLPGSGKTQLLGLLRQLVSEDSELLSDVSFFVDHDYDGVAEADRHPNLFVTDRYSIENYLCDRRVIDEILVDELRCATDFSALDSALSAFDEFFKSLIQVLLEPMAIYRAGVLEGIPVAKKPDKLNGSLDIELSGVRSKCSWAEVVQFDPMPSQVCIEEGKVYIENASGYMHRGKWLLSVVRAWLGLVYSDRKSENPSIFAFAVKALGPSPDHIPLRSLAARSSVPVGFGDFIQMI